MSRTGLRVTTVAAALAVAASFAACGGSSENDDDDGDSSGTGGSSSGGSAGASNGGDAGTTSTGGSSPETGGDAGTTSTGGSGTGGTNTGGSTPNGGASGSSTGGTAPTGGSAGTGNGGSGGGGQECESDDDCTLFTDCCTCVSTPSMAPPPPSCDLVCITDRCSADGIAEGDVACRAGRCVVDRSCNHAQATCRSLPPPCPEGEVRAVEDGCWGPCLPPTDCSEVTACSDCGAGDVCVKIQPQIQSIHCVRPDPECTKGSYCECLDTCSGGFVCVEDDEGIACPCPAC
jgi:hypothetical protein